MFSVGRTPVGTFGADRALDSGDFGRFKTGPTQPHLGDSSWRQADSQKLSVIGFPFTYRTAISFFTLEHGVSRRFGDLDVGPVGLRFCHGLPTYIDQTRQVSPGDIPAFSSRIFSPSRWFASELGRYAFAHCAWIPHSRYTAARAKEHTLIDINDTGRFDPDFHIVRRKKIKAPRVIR